LFTIPKTLSPLPDQIPHMPIPHALVPFRRLYMGIGVKPEKTGYRYNVLLVFRDTTLTSASVWWKLLAATTVFRGLFDLPSVRKIATTGTPSCWRPCCWIISVAASSPAAEFVPGTSSGLWWSMSHTCRWRRFKNWSKHF